MAVDRTTVFKQSLMCPDEMRTEVNWTAGSNEIVISGNSIAYENGEWTRYQVKEFDDPWASF